ncbi:MAG: tRNA glutamyl-Q(34) synthetase GluQRS [Thermomonas sp.]|uniref:tRNA glutamyl-Q(34) synthetase GluQRS n=1 Tax=Thermomonas sp. TaxID=1971895 RepID=UPI001EC8B03D|nr:tRNA glutamyl-Q(34) synthetase GluQRS [Thermomonas sp.]MBK6417168.1 tRNA glutamyl-Q(34) synthetase GluQRS [Thermomonas sp.]MBK6924397.1 tRNA glutamyl-Q(34) synthetase GluQRS [Thermomonas sp.]MBK9668521.1 tRNA glutamyl-Q(34) synthetase GluQRS [Thermomonas sp.]HQY81294.1 tRNA glutamyl-Q(34) synthetase GluQRS [Thermomonas sp.]HRA02440.1 tRNA glutamyl-Q(34) synthetase GluQRS [Thermomonas sp.]
MPGIPYRGRFAPSPTGPLHAGSLLAALGSWLLARQAGGEWLLRIEDIDPPREVAGAAAQQLRTLQAFGLRHDGEVAWQSRRGHLYRAALNRLLAQGLAFECHCSRADVAAAGGIHRRCVATAPRPDPAIRLRVADGCEVVFDDAVHGQVSQQVDRDVGDFVLRRTDGLWAYQLAVVVDDAAQGVTDVVRGADLLDSTARQVLLQRALGLPMPRYAHLPLLLGEDGRKLSKSDAALPVDAADPLPSLHMLWTCLGQPPLPAEADAGVPAFLQHAIAGFRLDRVPRRAQAASAAVHNTPATSRD